MATQREKMEFVARLAKEASATPDYKLVTCALKLMRLATSHHRLAELACNQELTPFQQKAVKRWEQQAHQIAAALGLKGIIITNDPRGMPFKLILHSGKTNDFGNEGFCVPLNGRT